LPDGGGGGSAPGRCSGAHDFRADNNVIFIIIAIVRRAKRFIRKAYSRFVRVNNLHVFAAHPSRSRVGKGPQRVGKAVAGRVVSARSGGTSARAEFRSCTRILRHKKRADDGVEIFTTSRSANATPPHSLAHRIFSKALFVVVGRMALLIRLHRCRVSSAYFRAAAAAVCIMIILIIIIIIMLLCRPLGTVMVMCFDIIIYPVYQLVGNIQCIGVGVVIIDAYYAR